MDHLTLLRPYSVVLAVVVVVVIVEAIDIVIILPRDG